LSVVQRFWRHGMTISAVKLDPTSVQVSVTDDRLVVTLADANWPHPWPGFRASWMRPRVSEETGA